MSRPSFQQYLSQIASRLRHDLKGGLITLKMGLESLDDGESLKPLLMEKTQEMVDLSDKLILILRMGELKPQTVGPASLFQHAARQISDLFPKLDPQVELSEGLGRWMVDPDAVNYALLELAQNATLAGAGSVKIKVEESENKGVVRFVDDGGGFPEDRTVDELMTLGQSGWNRSGLGLSVVESCLSQHGGQLAINRDSSGRTSIEMIFPLEES